MKRRAVIAFAVAGTFSAVLLISAAVTAAVLNTAPRGGEAARPFSVEDGEGLSSVAARLKDEGIIRSAAFFKVIAALSGSQYAVQRGDYLFEGQPGACEILSVLTSGKQSLTKVVIPEGFTARQTAEILFPGAKQVQVQDLREMCFGSFEGRNYKEMEHDPDYLAWVQANCETTCPDGERKTDFCNRTCAAFSKLVEENLAQGREVMVIVAHGGTQMSVMERYAVPHKEYYQWCAPNAGGYLLDACDWQKDHILHLIKTVQYTKEAAR